MTSKQPHSQWTSRTTKSGRKLWYELSVIQEPSRARACGSGAKSSADRRPVDPPPVVKLQIHEEKDGGRQDITFAYTANFFLFATLEVARPIAHGRVQQAPSPIVPVLTGMPVSGMAYLDRPNEAGYFIFPDLSVRHEGTYRLSFNLYEQTKLDEDRDGEGSAEQKPPINGPAPDSSFDWRMEIKSTNFVVFSAKKFPGLAESTSLSRTVAEQGCRVRIRRDVRMRRRDGKGGADENQEEEYSRIGRPQEQEAYPRSRSNSGSPTGSPTGPRSPTYDGPGQEGHGTPSFYSPSVPPQQNGQPKGNYLNFGQQPGQPQFPQPQFAQPQPPQQPSVYQPAPAPYQPPGPPQYHNAPQPPYETRQYPQTAHPAGYPRERESDNFRRASFPPPPPQQAPNYRPMEPAYQPARPMYSPPGAQPESLSLPPINKMIGMVEQQPPQPPPLRRPSNPITRISAVPLPSPSYDHLQERTSYYGHPAPFSASNENTGKRSWDSSFPSAAAKERERLLNGQRPLDPHANSEMIDENDALDTKALTYKRANGHMLSRECVEYE